jgi:hypothetical protein
MSYLINDNLIWIITPKCASNSIETALLNSNLKLKTYNDTLDPKSHIHIPLNDSLNYFGNKETVCITRDWFGKWLSALNFIWDIIEFYWGFTPICKWEDIDNDFIYNTFDTEFLNHLHWINDEGYEKCIIKLLKINQDEINNIPKNLPPVVMVLISEKYYKSNQKCTYEFDIKELDKFVKFIEDRFGEKIQLDNLNTSTKRPNKIIINDELKSFVWEKFEKPFEKRNQLI